MITTQSFGALADGRQVTRYTLVNGCGTALSLLDFGATAQALVFGGKDLLVGFETAADYDHNDAYFGATVGRYAGRITRSTFVLNGKEYHVTPNSANALHGGKTGWSFLMWGAEILADGDEPAIRFSLRSPDGDMGFPGNVDAAVTHTLTADNVWRIDYAAMTDADTPLNLTNHSYFNFNGYDGGNVLDTLVTIYSDKVMELSPALMPSGNLLDVEGTAFDFRSEKSLRAALEQSHPMIASAKGIDTCYVLGEEGTFRHACTMRSNISGIGIDCWTDMEGFQTYMGNYLDFDHGKGGPITQYQGVCMETQRFADSVNRPEFPSTILKAGEKFCSRTEFRLFKR